MHGVDAGDLEPATESIRFGPSAPGLERAAVRLRRSAYAPHRHDTYAIGITTAGVQRFRYRGRPRICEAGHMLGVEVRGVLGTRCFSQTTIELNFDRGRWRLLQHYQPPEHALFLPIKFNEAGPIVATRIEGANVNLLVDTGSNAGIGLRRGTFDKLAARGAIAREPESAADIHQGANGAFKIRAGRFTRGNLLGIDLQDMPVEDDGDVDVLGALFLLRLNSVLDLAGKRFYFEPRKNAEPPLRTGPMLGAAFTYPAAGQCRVAAMTRGGPAEAAGIQMNDLILKLGPLQGRDLNEAAIYDLCETHAGQAIDVQFMHPGASPPTQSRLQVSKKQSVYPPAR